MGGGETGNEGAGQKGPKGTGCFCRGRRFNSTCPRGSLHPFIVLAPGDTTRSSGSCGSYMHKMHARAHNKNKPLSDQTKLQNIINKTKGEACVLFHN